MSAQSEAKHTAGVDTRQRILAVALELFSTQGYAGTSIRDIAEPMGMTTAALYYHFKSKEQILEAVTEPLRTEMEALLRRATETPTPAPDELLGALVDLLSRHAVLFQAVFNDPSALHQAKHERSRGQIRKLVTILAGSTTPEALLRARCALGAVQAGILGTAASDPSLAEPLSGDRALRLLDGATHAVDAELRAEVAAAALRALRPPDPGA